MNDGRLQILDSFTTVIWNCRYITFNTTKQKYKLFIQTRLIAFCIRYEDVGTNELNEARNC